MYSNLKDLRVEHKVTVEQICNAIGLRTKAAYYKKESGSVKFTLQEAKIISDLFKLPIEKVFFAI